MLFRSVSLYFDDAYTIPYINGVIESITGTDEGFDVEYVIEDGVAVFTVTLDASLESYKEEIKSALDAHFEGTSDVEVIIVIDE